MDITHFLVRRDASANASTSVNASVNASASTSASANTISSAQKIDVYTDGSCLKNPGPGGWAFCSLQFAASGHSRHTTNQEMELQAMYEALSYLRSNNIKAHVHSDSQYVIKGLTSWCAQWQKRDFTVTGAGTPLQHADLWRATYLLYQSGCATVQWVKAHAGNPGNERADQLARSAAQLTDTSRSQAFIMPKSKSSTSSKSTSLKR